MLDEQVRRAMQKWPQVPAVYGWLRLSRRGATIAVDPTLRRFRGHERFEAILRRVGAPMASAPHTAST